MSEKLLKAIIKAREKHRKTSKIKYSNNIESNKKYDIIYADPPWFFNDRKLIRKDGKKPKFGTGAVNNYNIMETEDICNLDVSSITNENSVLFLWTTSSHMPDALEVMKSWGFKYINVAFVWTKITSNKKTWMGLGNYTRQNCEFLLFGKRGKGIKRINAGIKQSILLPHNIDKNGKKIHSSKPFKFRKLIVKLFGDLPRLEMFSRDKAKGWDVWGLEVKSDVKIGNKNEI